MIWEAYVALDAVGSNKVYLYLLRLESPVKAELSHWCNNLTRAGPGCQDSHQTDKDVHKRIYIGCHGGYRFLSSTYRCNIHAHPQQHTDRDGETDTSHTHTRTSQVPVPFIFTIYATKPTDLSDLTSWFWFRFEVLDDKRKSHRSQIWSDSGTSSNALHQNTTGSRFDT